jgi:FKBP-type peptidyl-prolyl cis-trans isomerase 2
VLSLQVPRDHPEVQRLEGRYKNVGGLAEGLVVELANGKPAAVVEVTDELVRLDANAMLAGKTRFFELELVAVEPPSQLNP